MKDIQSKEDIQLLVDSFYQRVLNDDMLVPFFKELNFEHHLPRMVHFWSFVCLDEPGYTTNITEVHSKMRLSKELFDRWVQLFHTTVDSLFMGDVASKAKERAFVMGWTMSSKLS